MRVLVLQNFPGEGIGRYGQRLLRLGVAHDTIQVHAGQALPPLPECAAILVGGTPAPAEGNLYHEFLLEEARYLKSALDRDKPVLGIRSGALLLARLLGGEVRAIPAAEIGAFPVRLTAAGLTDPLFRGFPKIFPAFRRQREAFGIPPWGLRLASGWESPNQGFRLGRAVGLHFHLEMTDEDAGFLGDLPPEELSAARKSRARIVQEWQEHKAQMAELADRLLDNFLADVPA